MSELRLCLFILGVAGFVVLLIAYALVAIHRGVVRYMAWEEREYQRKRKR